MRGRPRRGGRPLGAVSLRVLAALEQPRTMREVAEAVQGTVPVVSVALRNLRRSEKVLVIGAAAVENRGPVFIYARADE